MYLVTEKRALLLAAELQRVHREAMELRRSFAGTRCGGNDPGSRGPEHCNDLDVLDKLELKLREVVGNMQIVNYTKQVLRVEIGSLITLEVEAEPKRGLKAETRVLFVSGFGDEDGKAQPFPIVTNMSPLSLPFMGRRVGHEASVELNGFRRTVVLEKIELPSVEFTRSVATAA